MTYFLHHSNCADYDLRLPEGMNIQMVNTIGRLDRYQDFFKENVKDKIVLDVGAGLGLIGFRALQFGARHVYFVEQDNQSVSALRQAVAQYPHSDRVTVIHGDFHELDKSVFTQVPDFLVCELWGPHLWNEGLIPTHAKARNLFPNIRIVPDTYRSFFSIVKIPETERRVWPEEQIEGVSLASIYKEHFAGKLMTYGGLHHKELTEPEECFSLRGHEFTGEFETHAKASFSDVFLHISHKIYWPGMGEGETWRNTYCYVPKIEAGQKIRMRLNEIYLPEFQLS